MKGGGVARVGTWEEIFIYNLQGMDGLHSMGHLQPQNPCMIDSAIVPLSLISDGIHQ